MDDEMRFGGWGRGGPLIMDIFLRKWEEVVMQPDETSSEWGSSLKIKYNFLVYKIQLFLDFFEN